MKDLICSIFTILLFFLSCQSTETKSSDDKSKVSDEVIRKQEQILNASPFLSLGCCDDEKQRQNSCCCNEVIKLYEKMAQEKNDNLADYKMTDPILGGCRDKTPVQYDNIDNKYNPQDLEDIF